MLIIITIIFCLVAATPRGTKLHHMTTPPSPVRQQSCLLEFLASVAASRASCTASANRLLARSCFSIDLFAPKPSFAVCCPGSYSAANNIRGRLLKYARAEARMRTHTHTCTARSSSRISHTLEDRCFQACWKTRRRRTFILQLGKRHQSHSESL